MLLGISDFVDRQVLAALFPFIKEEYALSDTQLGLLVSVVNISIALLVIPCGYLIDRWSRKKMMALMAAVWSIATGCCAFSTSFVQLLIARFFVGAGEAGYNPAGQSLLAASFPRELRTSALGCLQFSMAIGSPLGLVAGAYIASHWGWRHAFGIVAVPGLVMAVLALFIRDFKTVKKAPASNAQAPHTQEDSFFRVVAKLLRTPTLICVFVAQASCLLFAITLMNWLPSYFHREAGMSVTSASSLTAVYLIVYSLALLVSGPIIDWMRRTGTMRAIVWQIFSCQIAVVMVLLAFAMARPGSLLQIGLLIVHNFFALPLCVLSYTLTADLSLPHQRATAVSLIITVQNIFGMAVGPLLAGVLSDLFNLGTALLIMVVFYALAGLLYILVALFYRRDLAKVENVELDF